MNQAASVKEQKRELRQRMLAARKGIPAEQRGQLDNAINGHLASLHELESAPLVAAYMSDGFEPDLADTMKRVLNSGRRLCVPRSGADGSYGFAELKHLEPSALTTGQHSLKEPGPEAPEIRPEELKNAVWLVPGLAFGVAGARLGRGKGVYDRLLAGSCRFSIGVFYEFQKCESLPEEGHDLGLDLIVTEHGIRDISSKRKGEGS